MAKATAHSWTHFWDKASGETPGCLPHMPAYVNALIETSWADFFHALPTDADLLDLGTGNGAVLFLARKTRPDLSLTGVDQARTLPDPGTGIRLLPETKLTSLPFDDNTFGAVTSQFAIEYSALNKSTAELKRVLRPGGAFQLLCHHSESVIVTHNLSRLAAIKDLLSPNGLLDKAGKLGRKKKLHTPTGQSQLAATLHRIEKKHPDEPVIQEVAEELAHRIGQANCVAQILSLQQDLKMERRRIQAMKDAALTPGQAEQLRRQLCRDENPPQLKAVHIAELNAPLAWKISNRPQTPGC